MPGHHALSLHDGKTRQNSVLRIGGIETFQFATSSESLVAAGKRSQFSVTNYISIKVCPYLFLSPAVLGSKMGIYVRWNCNQPKYLRVEFEFLFHYPGTVLH